MPANYLLHRVVIGRVSTGLSHTLSPFLFALEELMSCDTHQTALESRPAALPLPTVLRIAGRGNCCHDNFIPRLYSHPFLLGDKIDGIITKTSHV